MKEIKKLIDLKEGEVVTISKLQRKYEIGFRTASKLFQELLDENKIVKGKNSSKYYYIHEPEKE